MTDAVKLASNENPLWPSPLALKAARLSLANIHRYPDGAAYALRDRIAAFHGARADEVLQGAGSNELLDRRAHVHHARASHRFASRRSCFIASRRCRRYPVQRGPLKHTCTIAAMAAASHLERGCCSSRIRTSDRPHVGRPALETFLREVPPEVIVVMDEAYFETLTRPIIRTRSRSATA